MTIYVVKPGDSIDSIAGAYGIFVDSIIYNNQLIYPYKLAVGQALLLTVTEPSAKHRSITANGYAYPFIDSFTLAETLPYLSALSVFSYGFTPEGNLVLPPLDDAYMISAALKYRAAPILTLTPFGIDGQFNNVLINLLVNDQSAIETLISQLLRTIQDKGFQGVDIDFEYILEEDKYAFSAFVEDIRIAVNAIGYPVSVALAPKTSDSQQGLLYSGKDYALLGEAADSVLLMTYEWGYSYGPPMAVAPINKVREVVEYAITRIPEDKIDLGIPNYGYDWPLPYQKGVTKADTISNLEAVQIAIANNAVIEFDYVAMSPHFQYTVEGIRHEVWFEDVRSMKEKFALIGTYHLRGTGCWQIMNLFRASWLLLADTFRIIKQN